MRVDEYLVTWNVEMRCKLHANAPVCLMRNDPVNRARRNPLASRRGQTFFEQPCSSLRNPAVIMAEAERRRGRRGTIGAASAHLEPGGLAQTNGAEPTCPQSMRPLIRRRQHDRCRAVAHLDETDSLVPVSVSAARIKKERAGLRSHNCHRSRTCGRQQPEGDHQCVCESS